MSAKSVLLSSKGLTNIIWNGNNDENEFYFHFGDHIIKTNNFFAEFISPTVSHLHLADPTITSIGYSGILNDFQNEKFEIITNFFNEDIFSLLERLMRGNSIEINEDQSFKLRLISILLGNEELFNLLEEMYPISVNESKIEFYLQQLQLSQCFQNFIQISSKFSYSSIIDFISRNFYSIDETKLLSLPIPILHSILSHKHLKIESEDWLLDFIEKVFQNKKESKNDHKPDIFEFYELIEIFSLSDDKFCEFISNIDISRMTVPLWNKLRECLFISQEQREKKWNQKRYTMTAKSIQYDGNEEHRFNGIVRWLSKRSSNKVSENGTVKVTASSTSSNYHLPKFAVDFDDSNYFISNNEENAWLQYDFGERKVRPTKYSMRSRPDGNKGYYHLKSWVIEGSNTGNKDDWKTLDKRNNIGWLDGRSASHTFEIQSHLGQNEYFKYLRVRITGPNSYGENYYNLILSALEYFGFITE